MLFAKFSSRSSKALARTGVLALAIVSSWAIFLALVFLLLALAGCVGYNPALYASYDVLNPGPEVRLNPIDVTADGNFIVNPQFLQWVFELKAEILKLRKGK